MTSIYAFSAQNIHGEQVPLARYQGQVMLIVNTASKCGLTPQYEGLEALYEDFKDQGLVILGFPCNQFAGQEPGNEAVISDFCQLNYGVTFPLFAKIEVNGDNAHPLYQFLKEQAPGVLGTRKIKWNFTKFLIDRNGQVVKRYAPATKPSALRADITKLL